MKQELKRIEETLNKLEKLKNADYPQPTEVKNPTFSFKICRDAPKDNSPQDTSDSSIQKLEQSNHPDLPNLNTSNSSDRLIADTNTGIDQEINLSENAVEDYSQVPDCETFENDATKLSQVVSQIQDLYYEGPIVDGWLEFFPPAPEAKAGTLREVSFERAIDHVVEVCIAPEEQISESPNASYLLCGLDELGNLWSYPCPLEQLPSVSIAIARYHKLQQLLQQKHHLETQLNTVE